MGVNTPPEIHDLVAHDLRPGEQLRWVGQPVPTVFALSSMRPSITLAAIVGAGALVVYIVAAIVAFVAFHVDIPPLTSTAAAISVFVVAFVVAILYVLRHIYQEAKTTVYAITDHRVMIVYRMPRLHIDSYGPYGVWEIQVQPTWGNTAHVIFAKNFLDDGYLKVGTDIRGTKGVPRVPAIRMMKTANPALSRETSSPTGVGFYAIREADKVAELLHGTLKSG